MGKYLYRAAYYGPRKVAAEVVAEELARLRRTGGLTASRVVEQAEPEDAPTHAEFEWDDAVCGREYRLIQARRLIRAIVEVPEREGEDAQPRAVYVHVPDREAREGRYVPLSSVVEDEDEYARALTEAKRHLDAAEARFGELRRLAAGVGGKTEALAIAIQGFAAVQQAIELLRR